MGLKAHHDTGRSVTVTAGNVDLLTYVYAPDTPTLESPKPYLHPVRTLAGDVVTAFRPDDHVWHKGIAWSLPYVGKHNFWGGPTYVDGQYVQLANNGSATHQEMTALTTDGDKLAVAHRLDWRTEAGEPVFDERRSLAVTVLDGRAWALVFATEMANVSGSTLDIGSPTTKGRPNAGYGGLFWRGPRSFTGGTVQSPERTGGGNDLRGTRAEWLAYRSDGGRGSTIVMVDDPANPRHPTPWFARSEEFACLCPAPFFHEEVAVPHGETVGFRYAVVVAAGDHGDEGTRKLAERGRKVLA
ncbi:PmoA family protein [Phytohabitans flavus]|uniref:Oxidoreductase n=1 Tax=Phytohabitans flavus TaxID=1076124 RepID=A0A6F8XQ83_9ACTN|nr:PmoA family protein [Phytohabitans flavus]BCB75901.1 hypothetical protein Pflav_023110 [Phytohabitans flavus]